MFPHLFEVQQPIGIALVRLRGTGKNGHTHIIHVQTTSGVLRSPRVGKATMKSRL
jgi:hypothetical protein